MIYLDVTLGLITGDILGGNIRAHTGDIPGCNIRVNYR